MEKIPYVLELEMPFVPRRLNEVLRQNRFKRNDEFKEIYHWMDLLTRDKRPTKPLEKCHITIIRKVPKTRFLDWDNMVASYKPVVDSLTIRHSGIIQDDNYDITGPWNVTQEVRPKGEGPCTYLRIEGLMEKARPGKDKKTKEGKNDPAN